MRNVRIIPRLDIKGANVVKGIQLEGLRVVGDPAMLARKYYEAGADELLYIDIVASLYSRDNLAHIIEKTTERDVLIPITVGGGVRNIEDIAKMLRSGADKVAINTAAVKNPELIRKAAQVFGSSTIVASIEAKKISEGKWEAYIDNGRQKTGLDVLEWVKKVMDLGAGEILITSVDKDGTRRGYDYELIEAVSSITSVPVIVSGGAGNIEHIQKLACNEKIDGIAVASILHYGDYKVSKIKEQLHKDCPSRIRFNKPEAINYASIKDTEVSIVDYNLGNLRSVKNAFYQIGAKPKFISTPQEVLDSDFLVLPGVGAFAQGMQHLKKTGLDKAIIEYASRGRPLLGICLGMQMLMTKSYEFGQHPGLDLVSGEVLPFETKVSNKNLKVPHVGWNSIVFQKDKDDSIFKGFSNEFSAYFVHSFYVKPQDQDNIFATSDYFNYNFCSVIKKANIYGCQFHPEKSGQAGLAILNNFLANYKNQGVYNAS